MKVKDLAETCVDKNIEYIVTPSHYTILDADIQITKEELIREYGNKKVVYLFPGRNYVTEKPTLHIFLE